jgi:hypothetical protein
MSADSGAGPDWRGSGGVYPDSESSPGVFGRVGRVSFSLRLDNAKGVLEPGWTSFPPTARFGGSWSFNGHDAGSRGARLHGIRSTSTEVAKHVRVLQEQDIEAIGVIDERLEEKKNEMATLREERMQLVSEAWQRAEKMPTVSLLIEQAEALVSE